MTTRMTSNIGHGALVRPLVTKTPKNKKIIKQKNNMDIDTIYNMDCLEGMKDIPDGSIDAIRTI